MTPRQMLMFTLRRALRVARLAVIVGVIPLLFTGCYRSLKVIDHLDIRSGSRLIPSMRFGSGDAALFCTFSPRHRETWSFSTWHDSDRDCPALVLFADVDLRGPGVEISIGYFGLILLSAGSMAWLAWHRRREQSAPPGGFEVITKGADAA